jgi:hypothetical protein
MNCICRYSNGSFCDNQAAYPHYNPKVCKKEKHINKYNTKIGGSNEDHKEMKDHKESKIIMPDEFRVTDDEYQRDSESLRERYMGQYNVVMKKTMDKMLQQSEEQNISYQRINKSLIKRGKVVRDRLTQRQQYEWFLKDVNIVRNLHYDDLAKILARKHYQMIEDDTELVKDAKLMFKKVVRKIEQKYSLNVVDEKQLERELETDILPMVDLDSKIVEIENELETARINNERTLMEIKQRHKEEVRNINDIYKSQRQSFMKDMYELHKTVLQRYVNFLKDELELLSTTNLSREVLATYFDKLKQRKMIDIPLDIDYDRHKDKVFELITKYILSQDITAKSDEDPNLIKQRIREIKIKILNIIDIMRMSNNKMVTVDKKKDLQEASIYFLVGEFIESGLDSL